MVANEPVLLLLKTTLPVSPPLATWKFAPLRLEPLPLTKAVPSPEVPTFTAPRRIDVAARRDVERARAVEAERRRCC